MDVGAEDDVTAGVPDEDAVPVGTDVDVATDVGVTADVADAEDEAEEVAAEVPVWDAVLVPVGVTVRDGVCEGDTIFGTNPTPAYIVLGHAFRNATPNPDVPTSVESYNTM